MDERVNGTGCIPRSLATHHAAAPGVDSPRARSTITRYRRSGEHDDEYPADLTHAFTTAGDERVRTWGLLPQLARDRVHGYCARVDRLPAPLGHRHVQAGGRGAVITGPAC